MKIGLSGLQGKMNLEIAALAGEAGDEVRSLEKNNLTESSVKNFFAQPLDVFIDFSDKSFWPLLCKILAEHQIPLVSGTTGIESLEKDLRSLSTAIPVVHEKNFSEGIFLLKAFLKGLDTKSYGITIEEEHHRLKRDSPSGTAIDIAQLLDVELSEIAVKREDKTIGRHRISLDLEDEQLIIEHQAISRRLFARGALKMARWLLLKPKGLYTMEQYMNEVKL